MRRPDRRPLLTPLRISVALHVALLALLVHLVPAPAPAPEGRPATFRFVRDDTPEPEPLEVAAAEPPAEPVDTLEPLRFDVLLPPLEVEDTLRPPDAPNAIRRPAVQPPSVPPGAGRRPRAPRPPVARPAAPPAAPPQAAPRPARRTVPRVVRRPGTLRGFYPRDAQRQGIEGQALVLVRVDAGGQVVGARIHTSSGHASLDAAALRVARLYEFAPGHPGRALLPVPFRLRDG